MPGQLKPDDTFTCEMLTEALKDVLEEPAADPTAVDNEMMDITWFPTAETPADGLMNHLTHQEPLLHWAN